MMGISRDMLAQITEHTRPLRRRVANMIARAVVQLVDDGRKLQIVQLGVQEGEDVDDCERFQEYGFSSVPLPGAEAVVAFPNGDRSHALIVAVDDRRYRPTGWEPGEVGVYNNAGAMVRLKADGTIEITAGGSGQALALAADLEALRLALAALTSGPTAPVGSAAAPLGPFTGTTKIKAE